MQTDQQVAVPSRHDIIASALKDHANGKSLRQIAEHLSISHVSLRAWMLDEAPEQYKAAQRSALIQRVVEADEMLETATDMINVARSNSIAKYARWDAERRLPQLFGDKQGAQTGNITVVIRTLSGAEATVTIGHQRDQDAPDRTLTLEHQPSEADAVQSVLDGGKPECA